MLSGENKIDLGVVHIFRTLALTNGNVRSLSTLVIKNILTREAKAGSSVHIIMLFVFV